jgi:hypothetical protein
MSKSLSAQEAMALRDLLKLEIQKLRQIGELELLDQANKEEEEKLIREEKRRIKKELEKADKDKEKK